MLGDSSKTPTLPSCFYGCGDYPEWIEYEGQAAKKEARQALVERFTEDLSLPPDLYQVVDGRVVSASGEPLPPWQEQLAAIEAKIAREKWLDRRAHDAVTLRPILDLFSNVKG